MAALLWYGSSSVAMWFVGKNLVSRAASNAVDYILNSNANDIIKDPHAVRSIRSLLEKYKVEKTSVAYEAMLSVHEALKQLEDVTEQAKMRRKVHQHGYFSRWRTFDASDDNKKIQAGTEIVLARLEVFNKLLDYTSMIDDHPSSKNYDNE